MSPPKKYRVGSPINCAVAYLYEIVPSLFANYPKPTSCSLQERLGLRVLSSSGDRVRPSSSSEPPTATRKPKRLNCFASRRGPGNGGRRSPSIHFGLDVAHPIDHERLGCEGLSSSCVSDFSEIGQVVACLRLRSKPKFDRPSALKIRLLNFSVRTGLSD